MLMFKSYGMLLLYIKMRVRVLIFANDPSARDLSMTQEFPCEVAHSRLPQGLIPTPSAAIAT